MRLYLSSDRFGDHIERLLELAGQGARVGVIANAADLLPDAARENYARNVHDPIAELREHGLDAADLDLRQYFAAPDRLAQTLAALDMVWVTGGNAFLLRRALRQSGFDRIAPDLIRADKLIYGGWSAGAVVAGPNLKGLDLMDAPDQIAEGYDREIVWDGLGLIAFHLIPHYESGHAESPAAGKVAMYLLDEARPYRTMRDGDVLISDASGIRAFERTRP
jgi:dipeptidase E